MALSRNNDLNTRSHFLDRKTLLTLILVIIVLVLYLNSLNVTFEEVMAALARVNLLILLMAIVVSFIALLFDCMAWWVLLRASHIKASLIRTYRVFVASWVYNLLVPTVGVSDILVRAGISVNEFKKDDGSTISTGDILPSIVFHRLLGLLSFIPLVVYVTYSITFFFDISTETTYALVIVISCFALLIFLLFILIAKIPNQMIRITTHILHFPIKLSKRFQTKSDSWSASASKMITDYCVEFKKLWKIKGSAAIGFIMTTMTALTHWFSIYLIIWSFGILMPFEEVSAMSFLGGTIQVFAFGVPGAEGLMEIYTIAVLNKYASPSLSIVAGFMNSIIKFYLVCAVGVVFFAMRKKGIRTSNEKI